MKKRLLAALRDCRLCPRNCGVNRFKGETGFCRTGRYAVVSSAGPHFGEEPPLVGSGGSGTIFISWCNLGCIYCQNYTISHLGEGEEVLPEILGRMMVRLQHIGCENINFVTPTHVVPQIVEALIIAVDDGLKLPLVYNTGGYDKVETLEMIKGIFDIYMPDTKYSGSFQSERYSGAADYWDVCRQALIWMQEEVGELKMDERGVARKGLIIRHLVLPNNIAGSFEVLDFIVQRLSRDSYVNIMDQYRPCYRAAGYSDIDRPVTREEYRKVIDYARKIGLRRSF